MIIKVPIYVEIEGLKDQDLLPDAVTALNKSFTNLIRENFTGKGFPHYRLAKDPKSSLQITTITREKALESLRTKK